MIYFIHKATLKKSNKEIEVVGNKLNPKIAKIECKLTIVDKGLTGGLLTLYYTACTDGCEFLFKWDFQEVTFVGRSVFYPSINWAPDFNQTSFEYVISYFSNIIADVLRGNTGMIGCRWEIDVIKNLPKITEIVKDMPAEKAGLLVGDYIMSINGNSTFGKTMEEINGMFWGEAGTSFEITINRNNVDIKKSIVKTNRY